MIYKRYSDFHKIHQDVRSLFSVEVFEKFSQLIGLFPSLENMLPPLPPKRFSQFSFGLVHHSPIGFGLFRLSSLKKESKNCKVCVDYSRHDFKTRKTVYLRALLTLPDVVHSEFMSGWLEVPDSVRPMLLRQSHPAASSGNLIFGRLSMYSICISCV